MRGRMADGRRRSPAAIIVMIVLALLWTLPTFGMLVTSFRSRTDAASSGWWAALVDPFETGWTLDNYQRVLENTNLGGRSEEHTSELQSRGQLVCRRLLEK